MSLAGVFDTYWKPVGDEDLAGFSDFDFSYMGDSNVFGSEGYTWADTQISDPRITQTSLGQDFAGFLDFDEQENVIPSSVQPQSTQQEFDDLFDPPSIAQLMKREVFEALGIGKETAAVISRFAKGAQRGGGKERQAQAGGRTGPALPTSARAPTHQRVEHLGLDRPLAVNVRYRQLSLNLTERSLQPELLLTRWLGLELLPVQTT